MSIAKIKNKQWNYKKLGGCAIDSIIIYVLTPTKFHKEYSIAAANVGKHVFVEKPLALLPKDVDEMINARDKNQVKIQAGLVFRSAPVFEYLISAFFSAINIFWLLFKMSLTSLISSVCLSE